MIEALPIVTDSFHYMPYSMDYTFSHLQFQLHSWLAGLGKDEWLAIGAAYLFLGAARSGSSSRRSRR